MSIFDLFFSKSFWLIALAASSYFVVHNAGVWHPESILIKTMCNFLPEINRTKMITVAGLLSSADKTSCLRHFEQAFKRGMLLQGFNEREAFVSII